MMKGGVEVDQVKIGNFLKKLRKEKGITQEHFCEEKTAAEIAKAQNKNIKTVQTQIYRSRSMLKALLERSD